MSASSPNCDGCTSSSCSANEKRPGETDEQFEARKALAANLCKIDKKYVVLSGKGGVGKSTVAVNLALALAKKGKRVGLMDVDFHGPSVPTLLGIRTVPAPETPGRITPAEFEGVKVMSIGFLLPDPDEAVIWRGPMKMGAISQFLRDVEWGELDALVVDCPPGTGDEPLSAVQVMENPDGAVIVTTPQELALADVRKSVTFCRRLNLPVVGVIENMSGFACPHCGEITEIFGSGGGEKMAGDMAVPFLGRIPIDPSVVKAGDEGKPPVVSAPDSPAGQAFLKIAGDMIAEK